MMVSQPNLRELRKAAVFRVKERQMLERFRKSGAQVHDSSARPVQNLVGWGNNFLVGIKGVPKMRLITSLFGSLKKQVKLAQTG